MSSLQRYDISIIIACYNEIKVLSSSVAQLRRALDRSRFTYEIIFVDDASVDGTPELIREIAQTLPNSQMIFHTANVGRGKTVADGIRVARGTVAGFIDIDLATSAIYIPELAHRVLEGADLVLAWRIYKVTPSILHRWILSRGYHFLSSRVLGTPLYDTETGCKFFSREKILRVIDEIVDEHWFWDTEICVRSHLKGLRIEEVPTLYVRRPETGTTVKILRDTLRYLRNLIWFRVVVQNLKQNAGDTSKRDG